MSKSKLLIVSYLSPNLFWFYKGVARVISHQCNIEVEIIEGNCDPLDDPLLQNDQLDLAFICGLPLLRHNRRVACPLQALAAPVMQGVRYQNLPIYFADIVVNAASKLSTFADLKGARFCYNDVGSNSGYNLLRYRLIQRSLTSGFFSTVQQSDSHQRSLQWIATGMADCAAIDSVVLEEELLHSPELAQSLRVIESISSPMPPIVASPRLTANTIEQLQTILLHPDAELQAAMIKARILSYALVTEKDYATIAFAYDAAIKMGYEAIT